MTTALVRVAGFSLFSLATALGAQQQPPSAPAAAQAQGAQQQPPARPALKLRLNEIDDHQRRSIVGSQPAADNRQDSGGGLPGLGGKPARSWTEKDPEEIIPKSSPNIVQ